MKIISGKLKGKTINVPKIKSLRPTTNIARKGLFDILNSRIDLKNKEILDLFSGTGIISFEFLSRGAKNVTAIEINKLLCKYIIKNSKLLNLKIELYNTDALKFLNKTNKYFDIIFCDPPYNYEKYENLINIIFERNLLKERGLLIIEHSDKQNFSLFKYFIHSRNYGKTFFSFFSLDNTIF